jgi:hypothetical protein
MQVAEAVLEAQHLVEQVAVELVGLQPITSLESQEL